MSGRASILRFDHLRIPVSSLVRSRDWYTRTLGLAVEFEVPDRQSVALQDTGGFTIFLQEVGADVEATFAEWSARGVAFTHAPRRSYWGYGVELSDPDGYRVRLWDERSMKEK